LTVTFLALSLGLGCGDDTSPDGGGGQGAEGSGGRSGQGGGTTTGTDVTSSTTGSSTSSAGGGGGGQGGSGGGTTTNDGHQSTELVSAGDVCESPGYRLVYTLGQPTTNQETMTSTGYRLQGGFVGATGSVQ
jgi:hypothetical protein